MPRGYDRHHRMQRRCLQPLTTWLALLAVVVNSVIMPSGLVLCRDASGARLEVACDRDDSGACQTLPWQAVAGAGQESSDCCDGPCEDVRLQADVCATCRARETGAAAPLTFLMVVAGPIARLPAPATLSVAVISHNVGPPSAAVHLRSTILLI